MDANGMIEYSTPPGFFRRASSTPIHTWGTRKRSDPLADHQGKHAFWVNVWAGQNETEKICKKKKRTNHGAGA